MPINVTLLFSREQYLAAANAYMRGIERRIAAGLDPRVASVASLFVSRWDVAVKDKVPAELRNKLGIAIGGRTYVPIANLLASPRWRRLAEAGAYPQRLLWASTGTKDPDASATLYVEALAAPDTINTIPEKTLKAFAEHGVLKGAMSVDGGDAEAMLARFAQAGVDIDTLASKLQKDGAQVLCKILATAAAAHCRKERRACRRSLTQPASIVMEQIRIRPIFHLVDPASAMVCVAATCGAT